MEAQHQVILLTLDDFIYFLNSDKSELGSIKKIKELKKDKNIEDLDEKLTLRFFRRIIKNYFNQKRNKDFNSTWYLKYFNERFGNINYNDEADIND